MFKQNPSNWNRRRALQLLSASAAGLILPACQSSKSDQSAERLSTSPSRVIIIGAGIAGLTAANALRQAGIETLILEGRDRIGGRLHTVPLKDSVSVDFGGAWLHNRYNNPLRDFAISAGIEMKPVELTTEGPLFHVVSQAEGAMGPDQFLPAILDMLGFEESVADIAAALGPKASLRDGIEYYLKENLAAETGRREMSGHLLRFFGETLNASDWNHQSLENYLQESSTGPLSLLEIGQGDFPVGGYTGICEAIVGTADIRFQHSVTRIEHDRDGVSVSATTDDGGRHTFIGSHVLVTVPLGVLKADSIDFFPQLPVHKREAIQRLGFGQLEKVVAHFPEAFWHTRQPTKRNLYYASAFEADSGLEHPLWIDLQHYCGHPTLACLFSGEGVRSFGQGSDNEALGRTMDILTQAYGIGIPEPEIFRRTDWLHDPYSRGAYSYLTPSASAADFDIMAEPVAERLLFAGEATSKDLYGYSHGAYVSALREVGRLIGQENVTVLPYA